MSKTTILIVEDEGIVAADLAGKLEQGGYEVVGIAATGEKAVELTCRLRPQVVLMDILLKGPMDGIATAETIRQQHDIPIIYLTAHSDAATLERAKMTGPFGYILKPFEERELATQIEMAIYKHQAERELRQQRELLRVTLSSIGDAVITCDTAGQVTFLNPVAEALTGWKLDEAMGQPIQGVFRIINEQTRRPAEDIVGRVLREGHVVALANHTALLTRDGREIPIEDSAAPILDAAGQMLGVVLVFHDVAEKRRAEEELRQSEERFRTMADAIPQLAWIAQADGYIFWYNRRWYEYTGTTPEQMEGWGWQSVHDPEALPGVLEKWKASIATGEPFDMTFPLRGADGRLRPFLTRVMPLKDAQGRVTQWFGTNTDVDEIKRTESALRESEERLRLAYQGAKIGAFEWNIQTDVNVWTPELEAMYGLARGEFGKTQPAWEQLVHPEDRAAAVGLVNQTFQTGEPVEGEWRVVWRDGSVHWIAGRFQAFKDAAGKPLRLSGVNIDITERKRAEEELESQREWLRVTLTSIGDGVITCDTAGQVTFLNPVAEALSGWKTEEALGQPIQSVFRIINEQTRQPAEDIVGRVLREKLIIELANHTALVTRDGREVSIEDSAAPIMDNSGNVVGVVLVFHNVTDQRLAREELRQANAALANADRRKDEFLAMLAHELRNPLAPVRYAVQILRMPGVPEEARQRQQGIIDRQVTHMSRLLDDLLDVSRVTRGKVELQCQPLCLADVLVHAADTVRPVCEARRQQFHFAPPPADLRIEADIDRMAQVVGNLLVNASKFTGEGGQVWLEAVQQGEQAVIYVRDTGIGITPEFLPHIFDLFVQADDPRHRAQGGLGIGLTLVRLLVEMHGGTVEAHSRGECQGSEFIIRLPALEREFPEDTESQAALPEAAGKLCRRILVVDDIIDSATSLAEMLTLWGHEARAVHDGYAAIEMVHAWGPEIVLMDIGMPGMDGYEAARRLRGEHGRNGLKLVALTGFGQEVDRTAAREAGFDAHLVKPVDIAALCDLLGRIAD